jgi:hypothetical protein
MVFAGLGTDGGIQDIPQVEAGFVRSYLLGIALAREVIALADDRLAIEAEIQAAQHFAKQGNAEATFLVAARWHQFPWNQIVNTSVAVGEGFSYATGIPAIEAERGEVNSRLLNYIMFELELAPPGDYPWSLATRIHHRSGVFGLYGGASKGSNFVVTGLRFRF